MSPDATHAEAGSARPRRRWPPAPHLVVLALAWGVFGALVAHTRFLIDDAYISFRYARNWAEGAGPVWQAGEAPVEGFSNLLWVGLLALAKRLGAPLESASLALSVAFGAVLIGIFASFLRRELPGSAGRGPLVPCAVGTLALAAFPPFATWCTGGLETAIFSLLVFGSWAQLVGRGAPRGGGLRAGALGAALVLVRVEGVLWVALVAVSAATVARARGAARERLVPFLVGSAIALATLVLWRYGTFGTWLPNTVRAKSGLSGDVLLRGLRSSASYALAFGSPLVALFALPAARRSAVPREIALGAWIVFVGFLAWNVLVGGDWMPMYRFLAPATPFFALLLAALAARLGAWAGGALGAVLVAVALAPAFEASVTPRSLLARLAFREFGAGYQSEWERLETGRENLARFVAIGKGLAQVAGPEQCITLGAIGAIGYHSRLCVLDRNGLVEPAVAALPGSPGARTAGHDKRVPRAYFAPRRPDYYEAVLVDAPLHGPDSPGFAQAARQLGRMVFADPAERALLDSTLVEAHVLRPEPGVPAGTSLLLLAATDDADAARSFWRALGWP